MKRQLRHPGITLTEVLVVTAVLVILMGLSVPAAKKIIDSFDSSTGARSLINAALSSARAMAMANGSQGISDYAGVRFQQDRDGNTYMIYIVHDPDATGLAYGFRAVEGRKPIRLPENVGVMDGFTVDRSEVNNNLIAYDDDLTDADLQDAAGNMLGGRNRNLTDASTFSIVFSSSGHVVTQEVRVRNGDGVADPGTNSVDSVFNVMANVDLPDNPVGMFYQDDYGWDGEGQDYGIGPEMSRKSFILFDKRKYGEVAPAARWSGYLEALTPEMVSPYTGELIRRFEGNN